MVKLRAPSENSEMDEDGKSFPGADEQMGSAGERCLREKPSNFIFARPRIEQPGQMPENKGLCGEHREALRTPSFCFAEGCKGVLR
jgi:hypothetical protein